VVGEEVEVVDGIEVVVVDASVEVEDSVVVVDVLSENRKLMTLLFLNNPIKVTTGFFVLHSYPLMFGTSTL
jgi:hypothetical protein